MATNASKGSKKATKRTAKKTATRKTRARKSSTSAKPARRGRPPKTAAEKAATRKAAQKRRADRAKAAKEIARKARENARRAVAISADTKKRSVGRPPFEPTEEDRARVETLAGLGMRRDDIRQLVENPETGEPISIKTLERYFRRELARGGPRAHAKVAQSLFQKATGKGQQAVTAAIWFSKCQMGWRERVAVDVDVKSGVLVAPASASPEEWIAAVAARAATAKEPGTEGNEE